MLTIQNGQFMMDGEPFHIYSGAMHYFRVPRVYWEDRLLKLKAAGFNTVETYVCWNLHEPRPGEFDFSGMLDIAEYLRIAQKVGLYAIVRPGPYICAEWDFGGFPAWLLKDKNMRLRCNYEPYLECVRRFYIALGEQIKDLLQKNGGNIIAMQVENEYGSYGNDKQYLQAVREIMDEAGMDSFLFTSDGDCDWMLSGGGLPDIFKVMNFGSRAKTLLKKLDRYQENMPYMCGEFWCGWFDHWGDKHHTRPAEPIVKEIKDFLDMDASFNMYMFHGGTNFGFTAGANHGKQYEPTVTSYDYSAPLTEWGAYTPTYHAVRKLLLEKQGLEQGVLPPEPKLQYIGTVQLTESAGLFENLENIGEKHYSPTPESMEQFGQNFGYILYSTTVKGKYEAQTLTVEGVHDNAYLFIDGKLKKTYYRHENPKLENGDGFAYRLGSFKGEKKIEILVDAMGRVNYGKHLYDRKGISRVMLGNQILFDFDVYTLPLDNIEAVKYGDNAQQFPKFLKGTFKAATDADCFVDMTGFKKGCVFVNGFNLGRYWGAGPQMTLYLPKDVLKDKNEIVIFEQEGAEKQSVEIIDTPKLAKPKNAACVFGRNNSRIHNHSEAIMFFKSKYHTPGKNYTIPQIDLSTPPDGLDESLSYLFTPDVVDEGTGYLGHPDSVLLKDGSILTFFPEGHGKGRTLSRISHDGGKTYPDTIENPPKSWETSLETPTVYRLEFTERPQPDKLILVCGNPKWQGVSTPGGFNASVSCDEGKTWSEYELFYDKNDPVFSCLPIVPMSSLTKLKENGKFVDKWMGLFHDRDFVNYKTILTFDEAGKMHWSKPEPYFSAYRGIEKGSNMCEVECVRSNGGAGDELMLITRSNTKKINSLLSFSRDEGKTWSKPVEAPAALNGERHKAEWLPDGRLFITFRSVERDKQKLAKYRERKGMPWYSEGWVAWVGTYDDLKNGREGQYRIKIAHTYLNSQTAPCVTANGDTGYCGNVVLPDGTVVTSSYGIFSVSQKKSGTYSTDKGKQTRKTYIVSKRIRLSDVEKLL